MAENSFCDLCGALIPPHAHYIVRMEVFADPEMPSISSQELESLNLDETLGDLLEQMKAMSAEDLQDQVYRKFEYCLCRSCQIRFLANPLGKPRSSEAGHN